MSEIEVISVAERINKIDREVRDRLRGLKAAIDAAANAEGEYDKAIAIVMAELEAGTEYKLDSRVIKDIGTSNREKLAKGICWPQRCKFLQAQNTYKGLLVQIRALEQSQSGQQSIYSKLEQMAR